MNPYLMVGNGVELRIGEHDGDPDMVRLNDHEISMEDFFIAAKRIIEGLDLFENDSRLQFVECIKSMEIVDGFNSGEKRLEASSPLFRNY